MTSDLHQEITFDGAALRERYRVEDADLDNIRWMGERILPILPSIISDFEVWLSEQPEFAGQMLDDAEQGRINARLDRHWRKLFLGQVDEDYVASRIIVGEMMARAGLPLVLYLSGMSWLRDEFTARVQDLSTEVRQSLNRMLFLDAALVAECFPIVMNRRIAAQARSLSEMSTPVTELWDRVLMLPLVGIIDSHRANQVMTSVLQQIADTRATAFIMDISGVSVVDTAVANHLISIAKASGLMGCTALLSGVSPEIAATIVTLGIDVGDLRTHATLQDALSRAFELIGVDVVTVAEAGRLGKERNRGQSDR